MVVVDEKAMLPPPPAYSSLPRANTNGSPVPQSLHPPPFSAPFRKLATLSDLPAHLLLHIVHRTFPQAPDKDYNKIERQRKTLRWLTMSLRLVNRTFYIGMPPSHVRCQKQKHDQPTPVPFSRTLHLVMWLCSRFYFTPSCQSPILPFVE